MEHIQWLLSGIGTEILSLMIGIIGGGLTGYKIGVKKNYKQSQQAGAGAKQKQELVETGDAKSTTNQKEFTKVNQKQKAGRNAEQSQVGSFSDGK